MNQYLKNQKGAALILILFVVIFLGIVGASLLNTTTYSTKTVVNNKEEQQEFYRAEGALEIMLNEMTNYKDNQGKAGPYYFLYNRELPHNFKVYHIGLEDMIVTVNVDQSTPIVDPATLTEDYSVNVELTAKNQSDSKLERKLNFITTLNVSAGGTISEKAINYVTDSIDKQDNYEVPLDVKNELKSTSYNEIIKSVGINDWSTFDNYNKYNSEKTFPSGITILDSIDLSGKNEYITIPNNAMVVVKKITMKGNGNSNNSITVNGVLIAESIEMKGNSTLIVNSGIITNVIKGQSNSGVIKGSANGISCSLLPIACSIPYEGGVGKVSNQSSIENNSVELKTERNNGKTENK